MVHRLARTWSLNDSWYAKIEVILGEKFIEVKDRLGKKAMTKNEEISTRQLSKESLTSEEALLSEFYRNFAEVVITNDKPNELIPILAETYTQGQEHFYKMCQEIFPETVVTKLYGFMKDEIFRGKEYKSLPI